MIYCCPGTGGLFLTTVLAQILGLKVASRFSNTGHAHDMGNGNWEGAESICLIGDHWDLNYRPNVTIYYSHTIINNFLEKNPKIKLIKIDTQPTDYQKVTELYVKKAWPDIWTINEYNKWSSPEYPPYSPNNIAESKLIRDDLINDFKHSLIEKWHSDNINFPADHIINFRTIMGIDDGNLVDTVCNITNGSADQSLRDYVNNYQRLNQQLYFNNSALQNIQD